MTIPSAAVAVGWWHRSCKKTMAWFLPYIQRPSEGIGSDLAPKGGRPLGYIAGCRTAPLHPLEEIKAATSREERFHAVHPDISDNYYLSGV